MTASNHSDENAVQKALEAAGQVNEPDVARVIGAAKKSGSLDPDQFMAMLGLLVKKEARLAEKEAALEEALQARDAQRKHESESYTIAKIENQKACKHLKGGKSRTRGQQRDPNVFGHTFTDGTKFIKCNGCGAKWFPKDTKEYVYRNGNNYPNWTNIGWREASELLEDSSNKSSSSEIFPEKYVDNSALGRKKRQEHVSIPNLQL